MISLIIVNRLKGSARGSPHYCFAGGVNDRVHLLGTSFVGTAAWDSSLLRLFLSSSTQVFSLVVAFMLTLIMAPPAVPNASLFLLRFFLFLTATSIQLSVCVVLFFLAICVTGRRLK